MRVASAIEKKLADEFKPLRLEVIDESARHKGHAGARPEEESHFSVEIVSAAFAGKSRIERQRMTYGALAKELTSDIHALSLKTLTPEEDAGT